MKYFKPAFGFLVIGILSAYGLQSCKTRTLAMPTYKTVYLAIPYAKHDTIQLAPKKLTEDERKAMMRKFFKANYEEFMSPDFQRLELVNIKLERDVHLLIQAREEQRTRNIHKVDSLNAVKALDEKEKARLTNLLVQTLNTNNKVIRDNDLSSIEKIKEDKRVQKMWEYVITCLIVGFVIILISLIRVTAQVRNIEKEVQKLKIDA